MHNTLLHYFITFGKWPAIPSSKWLQTKTTDLSVLKNGSFDISPALPSAAKAKRCTTHYCTTSLLSENGLQFLLQNGFKRRQQIYPFSKMALLTFPLRSLARRKPKDAQHITALLHYFRKMACNSFFKMASNEDNRFIRSQKWLF